MRVLPSFFMVQMVLSWGYLILMCFESVSGLKVDVGKSEKLFLFAWLVMCAWLRFGVQGWFFPFFLLGSSFVCNILSLNGLGYGG